MSHHLDLSGGGEAADYVSLAALPGIPAVPQKVSKKLLGGEYVDMAEMRPDAWRMEELMYAGQSDTSTCSAASRGANKKAPCDRHSHLAGMFRGDGGCHHSKGP